MPAQLELYHPDKINLKVNFPTAWNDLTEPELHFVAKILLSQTKENAHESTPLIFHHILKQRLQSHVPKVPDVPKLLSLINIEQAAIDILPLLDFIFKENDRTITPSPLRLATCDFLPTPFTDITCGEFEDCEFATNEFTENQEPEHLAHLAAILFRPKNEEYIRYNSRTDTYITYKSESKIKYFLTLKPEYLYSIFIWYAGCRNQLQYIFPDLYDGGKKSDQPDPMVFTNTIHAGAGPKNGTRNQIRRMKLYEFLYDCNQEAKKAKELEAQFST